MFTTQRQLIILFAMALPFVMFYWMVPGLSDLTIGNDYIVFPIQHQMELAYSLEQGTFPLYAPGFAGGQSAAALTLGQIYHPIMHLARWIPGYWEGHALEINTVLRLLSLGICHLLLIAVLRRLGLSWVATLIVSMITLYNLRMLDHFRYGAALENHTAFIALGCLITLYYLEYGKRWLGIGIVAAAYLVVVGGHPQITYLGLLSAGLMTLMIPYFVPMFTGQTQHHQALPIQFWLQILGFVLAGIALATPYLFGFYFDFLATNAVRVENDYQWSLSYQDSVGGVLRNLYDPLSADVSGAFGSSPLILLALLAPLLILKKVSWVLLSATLLMIVAILLSMGDATAIHRLVWEYFPFANSSRVPGRYSILLILPAFFLLAWLFKSKELAAYRLSESSTVPFMSLLVLASIALYVLGHAYLDASLPASGPFTPNSVNGVSDSVLSWTFYLGLGTLILVGVLCFDDRLPPAVTKTLSLVLCLAVGAQLATQLRHGTWVVESKPEKTLEQMQAEKQKNFWLYALPGYGLSQAAVNEQIDKTMIDSYLARAYAHIVSVENEETMWQFIAEQRRGDQAVVINRQDLAKGSPSTLSDTAAPDDEGFTASITLTRATFNTFAFDVTSSESALVSTNLPFSPNWSVSVDGQPAEIIRANGNETAVSVNAGTREIVFEYSQPQTVYGGYIAAFTFALLVVLFSWHTPPKIRMALIAAGILLPVCVLTLWIQSFHGGESADTQYTWTSAQLPSHDNLAFAKKTFSSPLAGDQVPTYYHSGRVVNGNPLQYRFAFGTIPTKNPFWKVDLGASHALGRIDIYGLREFSGPVAVMVSQDNQSFQPVATVKANPSRKHSLRLDGVPARYVALIAIGERVLTVQEVEIFEHP